VCSRQSFEICGCLDHFFFQALIIDLTTAMVGAFFHATETLFLQPGMYVSCTCYPIGPDTLPLWQFPFIFFIRLGIWWWNLGEVLKNECIDWWLGGGPHYLYTMKGCRGTLWQEMRPYGGRHPHTVKGCPFPNYTD
jgi:hypothetical protein